MIIQFKKLWTKTIFLNRISYEMEEILVVSFPICRELCSRNNSGFRGKGCYERHTWGEDFNSPVKADGWKAYSYLKTIQRRWAISYGKLMHS